MSISFFSSTNYSLVKIKDRNNKKEDFLQALNIYSIPQKISFVNPQFCFYNKVLPIAQKSYKKFKHYANCFLEKVMI